MNNIGRIVFGCIAAVIIIVAIILLIPFGLSAENAKKISDETFANLKELNATSKYVQLDNEYFSMYFYNSKSLGDTSATTIGRMDFKKAIVGSDGEVIDGAYTSGSVIIGYMNEKWYVVKTAKNDKDGDVQGYKTFTSKNSALLYLKDVCGSQVTQFCSFYEWNLEKIIKGCVQEPDENYIVTGGTKAIAGAVSVTVENEDKTYSETLQISNNLIKKASLVQKDKDGKKTTSVDYTFKYNGELKMTQALINKLDEIKD